MIAADVPPAPPARAAAAMTTSWASWYGPGLYGNALGCAAHPAVPPRLTPGTLGVAHKKLPCGRRLRVCYRRRCATVRVVDRGPFVAGRTLDLTAATRTRVHFPNGVARVRWRVVG